MDRRYSVFRPGAWRKSATIALIGLAALGAKKCDGNTDPNPGPVEGPIPVLFVHGWAGEFGNSFSTMRQWLSTHGWGNVPLVEMKMRDSVFNCAEQSAEDVRNAVLDLLSPEYNYRVDIVAHSYGNLPARYFIKYGGGAVVVRNYVSITGPNHGTALSNENPWICSVTEMDPDGPWIHDLNTPDETFGNNVRYTAIRSLNDAFVIPSVSSRLAGALNVDTTLDHVQVLLQEPSFQLIKTALEGGGKNTTQTGGTGG
ncbi:MAG: hypothetical protein KC466_00490 [Myxococcales bacterium]|nr:hypothetical protein [Myxococcales bacterium]